MAEKKVFTIKVNGIEIETEHAKMVAHDILELAEKKGAIPSSWKNYILKGDKGEYQPNQEVDLQEDNFFITLRVGPTPVA